MVADEGAGRSLHHAARKDAQIEWCGEESALGTERSVPLAARKDVQT